MRKYPIGIQTFSELRTNGYLYVDKSEQVYRMTHSNAKYMFLSRPRRFGKSLLISTLESYFLGKKELFRGLAVERLESEWKAFPVLRFDMSLGKHMDEEALTRCLASLLDKNARRYGVEAKAQDVNIYLTNLIQAVYEKTGRRAVVLIDEYDAPLLDVAHEDENLPRLRNVMRNFYSPLKGCDPYLRYVFLTGITKFSQLSIFSELNNIQNISMDERFAAVCGITAEEMQEQMGTDIDLLAEKMKVAREEATEKLKDYYDGYHFTFPSPDIYNPYSLLNALDRGRIEAYWFGSGTPTFLTEMMRKFGVKPDGIGRRQAKSSAFDAPTQTMTDITPLLYQSGYLTIKDYDADIDLYTLDIPNREVRIGLMESLLEQYVSREKTTAMTMTALISRDIRNNDLDQAFSRVRAFLSTVPYSEHTDYEGHYQQMLYVIFSLLGEYVDIEVRTPRGRVDMVLRTATHLYVMELKLNQSASAAIRQIDLKEYPSRFVLCGLPVVKVGIRFDREKRTLGDWKIEEGDA